MAKKTPIGHIACAACDFPDAEVLLDKNEHPYVWCGECNVQMFSRGNKKISDGIRRKMRPVAPAPPAAAVSAPGHASPGTASPAGAEPTKKTSGFKTLLG